MFSLENVLVDPLCPIWTSPVKFVCAAEEFQSRGQHLGMVDNLTWLTHDCPIYSLSRAAQNQLEAGINHRRAMHQSLQVPSSLVLGDLCCCLEVHHNCMGPGAEEGGGNRNLAESLARRDQLVESIA